MPVHTDLSLGLYLSRDLLSVWEAGEVDLLRWITRTGEGIPDWAGDKAAFTEVPLHISEEAAQIEALRLGMGVSMLPCFVGDAEPTLSRLPGAGLGPHGSLWILTQGETRKTRRVRLFTEFMTTRLRAYSAVLGGYD